MRGLYRVLRAAYALLRAILFGKYAPISAWLYVGYQCNLECTYCDMYNRKTGQLSTEEIKKIIDEMAKGYIFKISITGGEAFLRKDLEEIVRYAKSWGFYVLVNTNGTVLNKSFFNIGRIADVFALSLDGPREVHDKNRGKGSFEATIKAIHAARKAGIPVFTMTVITKDNVETLPQIIEMANELDFLTIFQPVFFNTMSAEKNEIDDLRADREKFRKAIHYILEVMDKKGPILFSHDYYERIFELSEQGFASKCKWAGKLFTAVTPEGDVAPCNFLLTQQKWPSAKEEGFGTAFRHIPDFTCTCNECFSFVEMDWIFSLKPAVIRSALKDRQRLMSMRKPLQREIDISRWTR